MRIFTVGVLLMLIGACNRDALAPTADLARPAPDCDTGKFGFTQADGCANDGSLEFCIPIDFQSTVTAIVPSLRCSPGGGRAACDAKTQLLCFFYTGSDAACVTPRGAITDGAYRQLCQLSKLPQITAIVRTIFE